MSNTVRNRTHPYVVVIAVCAFTAAVGMIICVNLLMRIEENTRAAQSSPYPATVTETLTPSEVFEQRATNSVDRNTAHEPTMTQISDMEIGQQGYTVYWAFSELNGEHFVAGEYDAGDSVFGTLSVCIQRDAEDRFSLCGGREPEWSERDIDWGWIPIDG